MIFVRGCSVQQPHFVTCDPHFVSEVVLCHVIVILCSMQEDFI